MKNIVLHDNVVKANEIIGLDAVKALKRRGFEASMYAAHKRVIMYDTRYCTMYIWPTVELSGDSVRRARSCCRGIRFAG